MNSSIDEEEDQINAGGNQAVPGAIQYDSEEEE